MADNTHKVLSAWLVEIEEKEATPRRPRRDGVRYGSVNEQRRARHGVKNKSHYMGMLSHTCRPYEGYVGNVPAENEEQYMTPTIKEVYVPDARMRKMRPKGEIHLPDTPYPEIWRKTNEKRRKTTLSSRTLEKL